MVWFKAENTEYGGILYRSRLEARWALFFDENNIKHKYELAKVDLGIDKCVPDFWLPEFKLWIEIKPFRHPKPHSRCYRLAIETKRPVLLVQGPPSRHVIDMFDPKARRTFTHHTVVPKSAIKPAKELLQFQDAEDEDDSIVLISRTTNETIRFAREIDLRKPVSKL